MRVCDCSCSCRPGARPRPSGSRPRAETGSGQAAPVAPHPGGSSQGSGLRAQGSFRRVQERRCQGLRLLATMEWCASSRWRRACRGPSTRRAVPRWRAASCAWPGIRPPAPSSAATQTPPSGPGTPPPAASCTASTRVRAGGVHCCLGPALALVHGCTLLYPLLGLPSTQLHRRGSRMRSELRVTGTAFEYKVMVFRAERLACSDQSYAKCKNRDIPPPSHTSSWGIVLYPS